MESGAAGMGPTRGRRNKPGVRERTAKVRAKMPVLAGFLLVPAPAWAAGLDSATQQELVKTAVMAGAVAPAIAAALWALAEQTRAARLRRALRQSNSRIRSAVGERDALLSAGREALVVWGRDASAQSSYSNGEAMLEGVLAGAEATEVSKAIDALSDRGVAFAMTAHDKANRSFTVRGRAVGAMAAVWIEEDAVAAAAPATIDYRGNLDALPVAVWLRHKA